MHTFAIIMFVMSCLAVLFCLVGFFNSLNRDLDRIKAWVELPVEKKKT